MDFKDQIDNECGFHVSGDICIEGTTLKKLERLVIDGDEYHTEEVKLAPEAIANKLKRKYGCETETCILEQRDVENILSREQVRAIMNNRFKPEGPRDTTEWLSDRNIDSVLHQISIKYKDTADQFLHIPFQMRDFQKMQTELATLDFPEEYKKKFRTFGTVINTDYSDGNGIHWFALFGDFRKEPFTIEYFNSSGEEPLDEIHMWMKDRSADWSRAMRKPVNTVISSDIIHQRDNHSCGPYSLYYIISRLEGVPSEDFGRTRIKDSTMHLFRKFLFRKK